MKKQLMIIGIIVLLVCIGLSGCNDRNIGLKLLNGKWFELEVEITLPALSILINLPVNSCSLPDGSTTFNMRNPIALLLYDKH